MSQEQIIKEMSKKPGKWYKSEDLINAFPELSPNTIRNNLSRLKKHNEVEFEELKRAGRHFIVKYRIWKIKK